MIGPFHQKSTKDTLLKGKRTYILLKHVYVHLLLRVSWNKLWSIYKLYFITRKSLLNAQNCSVLPNLFMILKMRHSLSFMLNSCYWELCLWSPLSPSSSGGVVVFLMSSYKNISQKISLAGFKPIVSIRYCNMKVEREAIIFLKSFKFYRFHAWSEANDETR